MTNGLRSAIVTLALCVMATRAGAENISGCNAANTCTFEGVAYFAETVCSGGTCTPATTDTCPGHCTKTPAVACATDGPCNGTGNECEKDGNIPLCIAGSPRAGALCGTHGDCNDPPDDQNCQVGANFCCSGTGGPPFLGDGKIAILGSNSNTNADSVTLSTPPSGRQYVVCGRNGNDTITGGNGDDLIDGGNGTDTLSGGNGTDTIYGGDDDDTIYVAAGPYYLGGDDFADGGAGDDDIVGSNRHLATSPTSKDVGTTKNCETIIGSPISGRHPSCGCEG
jgi:hypothetical protein